MQNRKTSLNITLLSALGYAKRGWHVLPIHGIDEGACRCGNSHCERAGKHPVTNNGVKDASINVQKIRAWFTDTQHNIGIATGKISGIVVVDVDPRSGGAASIRTLFKVRAPLKTARVKTGNGFHLFYRYPGVGVKTSHGNLGPGIDLQSDGAYVIAPPSLHRVGKNYSWERTVAARPLQELPTEWLSQPTVPAATANCPALVSEGGRNSALMSQAGKLVASGVTGEVLGQLVAGLNSSLCSPPLEQVEVDRIVSNALRYENTKNVDHSEHLANVALAEHFADGRTLLYAIDGQFWHYPGTHWEVVSDVLVKKRIQQTFSALPLEKRGRTAGLIADALAIMKARVAAEGDVLRFNAEPPNAFNCKNGEVWIGGDGNASLKPHRPESYLRACSDIVFDPKATAPKYERALNEIFASCDDQAEMVKFWHRLSGYACQPRRPTANVVICWGTGSNGKTKLLDTLTKVVGTGSVLSMPVGDLEKSRFASSSLLGKLLFVDDDVQSGIKLPDGQLKRLSEEKEITGEPKFGAPFNFRARVLPILLCNDPPVLTDVSFGMRRRLVVIPFNRTFDGKKPTLFDDIWRTELPGILNLSLLGLKDVIRNNWQLMPPAEIAKARERLLNSSNPVPDFIANVCRKDPKGRVLVSVLYTQFGQWLDQANGKASMTRRAFGSALKSLGHNVVRYADGPALTGYSLA